MNVMIVDDEKLLRKGFRNMTDWSTRGIHIIAEAINGMDALNKLKELTTLPDVIITDIKMPVMDGVQLTQELKRNYPEIKVIILSGHDDYEYVRDGLRLGAVDYLLKATIDTNDICEILQRIESNSNDKIKLLKDVPKVEVRDKIDLDKEKIFEYIELQQFKKLKEHIMNILKNSSDLPITYFQEIIRDLFFFIEYTFEILGLPNSYLKENKYLNSASIQSINTLEEAINWFSLIIDQLKMQQDTKNHPYDKTIKGVVLYIEKHYTESISLAKIAEKFFVNKNYLCNIFKSQIGCTIHEYITNLRINTAKKMIRNSEKSLHEIANEVGYNNYSYFGKIFRRKNGISPNEYAKLYR